LTRHREINPKRQQMKLISRLKENRNSGIYPFHMPGHKRMATDDELLSDIYGIDITEIKGFDDLHNAVGILREAEEKTADLFGSYETHFLVNGSTGGILAAVCAAVTEGDDIVIASNCHRSVYNAVMLCGASLHVITPGEEKNFNTYGGITAGSVCEALDHVISMRSRTKEADHRIAVVITSPTYEGIVSDTAAIAKACHEKGAVLIVDAAHGAHLGFSDDFPDSPVASGADIVITSVHKTLPAMTQTALIHINAKCPSKDRVRKMLSVFATSSPSYVLMASIDQMTDTLSKHADQMFAVYSSRLDNLYIKAEKFNSLELLNKDRLTAEGSVDYDKGKIVVRDKSGKLSGPQLYDLLYDKYKICAEMATDTYVVLMTSVSDSDEGFNRLYDALCDIDKYSEKGSTIPETGTSPKNHTPSVVSYDNNMKRALFEDDSKNIPVKLAKGMIAKDMVTIYPPGVPVTIPGQVISGEAVDEIIGAIQNGLEVIGLNQDKEISVIWERSST